MRAKSAQELRHYTFPEAKAAVSGLADAPHGSNWTEVEGEAALRHARKGQTLEIKYRASPLTQWLGLPDTAETLWAELRRLGLQPALLYQVCLGRLLANEEPLRISLDMLIQDIGWQPRSTAQRQQMRRQVWRWLTTFDGWTVIGRRKGVFRDPTTKQIPDLWVDSSLFLIVERGFVEPQQLTLDNSAPPFEVTLAAGPWLCQFRGNSQILTYFGEVRRIASMPSGKPSGAWAQSIGLALHQLWRERAARARVARTGEDNHLTADTGPFRRVDLLTLFPPSPDVFTVLNSSHPGRARKYWKDAVALLQAEGVFGHYKELAENDLGRQEWEDGWLNHRIDIRPGRDGTRAIAEIARASRQARRSKTTRHG